MSASSILLTSINCFTLEKSMLISSFVTTFSSSIGVSKTDTITSRSCT